MIVEPDFVGHWKTKLLCDRLGSEAAPLRLLQLWGHCQLRKCDTFAFAPLVLKAVCGWPGDAQAFWEAMTDAEAGWLVPCPNDPGKWVVRGFLEVNGKLSASWVNGGKGGRPPKPTGNPAVTQPKTHGKPENNPAATEKEPGNNLIGTRGKPHSVAKHSIAEQSSLTRGREGEGVDEPARVDGGGVEEMGDGETSNFKLQASTGARSLEAWAEAIYQAYPRKVAKAAALRSILQCLKKKKGGGPEGLLAAVEAYAAAVAGWPESEVEFVPHPATWFNGGRFEDDPAEWERKGAQKNEGGGGWQRPEKAAVAIRVPRVHAELEEPDCDWRKVLKELWPIEDYPQADYALPWGLYEPDQREQLRLECVRRGMLPASWRQPGLRPRE